MYQALLMAGGSPGEVLASCCCHRAMMTGTPAEALKGVRSTEARSAPHPCRATGASGSAVILAFSFS